MGAKLKRQLVYGLLLLFLFVLGMPVKARAQPALNLAVAANFAPALEVISKRFTAETGIPVQLTVSSSGRFFAQIRQRAPFDVYFSADTKRPELLHDAGLCNKPKLYAGGRSVLWSRDPALCLLQDWKDVVRNPAVQRIAMASPEIAPYGLVARQACRQLDDWPEIEEKLIFGSNVSQAFQYAGTGVVAAAFIAKSLALTGKGKSGCFWEVQESGSVEQKACVVRYSRHKEAAVSLLAYVTSNQAADVLQRYGYR